MGPINCPIPRRAQRCESHITLQIAQPGPGCARIHLRPARQALWANPHINLSLRRRGCGRGLLTQIRAFGLYDNLLALTFSYMVFTLPFRVWVLTTFMREMPLELEEAAMIDGATPWIVLTRVFLPIMGPALATTGLLAFIAAWNEFLSALTFTLTDTARTVPVAIALISGASSFELPWGRIMAASVIVTVPLILLVLVFQRRIVAGLTAGAVKG